MSKEEGLGAYQAQCLLSFLGHILEHRPNLLPLRQRLLEIDACVLLDAVGLLIGDHETRGVDAFECGRDGVGGLGVILHVRKV